MYADGENITVEQHLVGLCGRNASTIDCAYEFICFVLGMLWKM